MLRLITRVLAVAGFVYLVLVAGSVGRSVYGVENLADEIRQKQAELEEIRNKIKELEVKLAETKQQKLTLSGQIAYYDAQIALTQHKIDSLKKEIEILIKSIALLEDKIGILDTSLVKMRQVMRQRLIQEYKLSRIAPASFLTGRSFNYGLALQVYLKRLTKADKKMIDTLQTVKVQYSDQKQIKERKKTQLDKVRQALALQKQTLDKQKQEKRELLTLTEGNEKRYQEMLATLKAEQENIANAVNELLSSIGGLENGQQVKKGDIIGRQGNTGKVWPRPTASNPTAGSHLHFMVLKCPSGTNFDYYKCAVDPEPYLSDSNYATPLASWRKTQGFGPASCAFYSRCFHYGYDMADFHGAPVYAIADGEVFYGVDAAGGKYAIIKHSDSFFSAYWHLK